MCSLIFASSSTRKQNRTNEQGTVIFDVGGKVYSLDLSSPTCNVSDGDVFNGKADLKVTCSEDVMKKMIRKEIQPQQGNFHTFSHHRSSYILYHYHSLKPLIIIYPQAFMKGMLKIKGKMNLAMKLNAVLAATRKKLPTSKM